MTSDVTKWLAWLAIIHRRDQIATFEYHAGLAGRAHRYGEQNHTTLVGAPREHRVLNGVSGSVRVIPCVGAVIKDDQGRLLLIKRGHAPGAGLWSLPGGRIEPGETDAEALVREMREETGLVIDPGQLIGAVRGPLGTAPSSTSGIMPPRSPAERCARATTRPTHAG